MKYGAMGEKFYQQVKYIVLSCYISFTLESKQGVCLSWDVYKQK